MRALELDAEELQKVIYQERSVCNTAFTGMQLQLYLFRIVDAEPSTDNVIVRAHN